MTDQQIFFNNPSQFLSQNCTIQMCNATTKDTLVNSLLYFRIMKTASLTTGVNPGPVFAMSGSKDQRSQFDLLAYWCPYNNNALFKIMLGNDALYAFTPTLDGCTLGIGTDNGAGGCLFGHVNAARSGTVIESLGVDVAREQSRKIAKQWIRSEVGLDAFTMDPMDYQRQGANQPVNAIKTTVWGTHLANQPWQFIRHSYMKAGNQRYDSYGATPFY